MRIKEEEEEVTKSHFRVKNSSRYNNQQKRYENMETLLYCYVLNKNKKGFKLEGSKKCCEQHKNL